ncbi:MAG: succinate--CoA ligase subunit beta [Deltaproteobacteria bacterium GWA2_38_16]|nr:MAG: succinate--CoA ligase subunit beta [Deltaproteobacteria bacterium GWA2_38_16]OGQ01972.1 MAG: succinate--CoA ligase subunit beta [Deltaproteobacteria bacterium RIFCSPHIGHO2_02_FULL_38_15]OGQ61137.1 MAG: succinate--CoA ligase subunit beta [Deltaproteobacteria bacterium RIFCSPLOWO2_12_FULL_38_8]HBQ21505.1 ADP-forming succinate--CoA ligase subunit beta [Deltaproteobacteria bacterium]
MKIHEYQAKEVLSQYGVSVPQGKVATTPEQARSVAQELGGNLWVVKAQIHAGGRGKGGGVKLARSLDEVEDLASSMIGMTLVTYQTGPEGKKVNQVLVEKGYNLDKEYYLAMVLDRAQEKIAVIASPEGGVSIEEVAHKTPEKIFKSYADSFEGFTPKQLKELSQKMGFKGETDSQFQETISSLYKAFIEKDGSLVEINPLVSTKEGKLLALDAKINFDDNALYRHPEIEALRDLNEEDPKEVEASKFNLSYISLHGNIGCMVNGAGLAMSTMDIIKLAGGEPANFLDVGGGATQEKVTEAFKLILSDKNVKGVLVNIFGGIMRCDIIARGILDAVKHGSIRVPLVVRLEGTNVEEGRKILMESGLKIISATTMKDAAQKVVRAIQ